MPATRSLLPHASLALAVVSILAALFPVVNALSLHAAPLAPALALAVGGLFAGGLGIAATRRDGDRRGQRTAISATVLSAVALLWAPTGTIVAGLVGTQRLAHEARSAICSDLAGTPQEREEC